MSKKEMGLAVKGLMEYAEICLDNENYQELSNVLDIAFSIGVAYDLKEIDKIEENCKFIEVQQRDKSVKIWKEYKKKLQNFQN